MENGNLKFRDYLLGNLNASETEELDLRLIADEGLEEQFDFAENELMEEYLDETLTPAELGLFEKNFLVSPARKANLRQIALLRNYADETKAENDICGKSPADSKSFWEKLRELFSPKLRLVTALTLFIIVSIGGWLVYNAANGQSVLEKEYAELNRKDLTDVTEYKNLTNVNLVAGVYRDAGGAAKLAESGLSGQVLFKLDLPVDAKPADSFGVRLVKDGKVVFTQNKIRFYNNPNGRELRFFMPAEMLKKGEYQIKVEKENQAESAIIYNFAVR